VFEYKGASVVVVQSVEELCHLKASVQQQVHLLEDKTLLVKEGLALLDRYITTCPSAPQWQQHEGGEKNHISLVTIPWAMAHWVYALKCAGYTTPDERGRIKMRLEYDNRLPPGSRAHQAFVDKIGVLAEE